VLVEGVVHDQGIDPDHERGHVPGCDQVHVMAAALGLI
jgi:hypothetical protein